MQPVNPPKSDQFPVYNDLFPNKTVTPQPHPKSTPYPYGAKPLDVSGDYNTSNRKDNPPLNDPAAR